MTHLKTCSLVLITVFLSSASVLAGYRLTLTPRISVSTDFTDNLFSATDNETHDYTTAISPGFTAQLLEKTRGAVLSYDMGYSIYDKFTQFNTFRHNAQLAGWFNFSKHSRLDFRNAFMMTEQTDVELEEGFETLDDLVAQAEAVAEKTEEDDTDADSEEADVETETETETPSEEQSSDLPRTEHVTETETIRKQRKRHYTNNTSLTFVRQFGEADIFNAGYDCNVLENDDPGIKDEISHGPSLGLTYWPVPRQWGLESNASFTRRDFSATPGNPDYWEENISFLLGTNYWFLPRELGIEAKLSYAKSEYLNATEGRARWDKSINPSLSLTYQPRSGLLTLEAGLSHTRGTYWDPSDDFDRWRGSLKLSKKFTRRFEGFFQYAHNVMEFKGDGEDYTVYEPTAGIKYLLGQGIPISLSLSYIFRNRQRSENEANFSLNGNIGKTWNFSRRGAVSFSSASGYDEDYTGAERLGFGIWYDAKSDLKYMFSQYLSGDAYATYRKDKYIDLDTRRNDETVTLGTGVTFQKKWFSLRIGYSCRTVNSTSDENDYRDNRINVRLVMSPARPIRLND